MNANDDDPTTDPRTAAWTRDWPTDDEATATAPAVDEALVWQVEGETLNEARALVDIPPLTAPQAQGDVIVLPWLDTTSPSLREQRVDAATEIDRKGCIVTEDGSHVLLPNTLHGPAGVRYGHVTKGHTLGTLVVEPGHAARLSHREHGDLLIGPGVYVLHEQRRWRNYTTAPVVD